MGRPICGAQINAYDPLRHSTLALAAGHVVSPPPQHHESRSLCFCYAEMEQSKWIFGQETAKLCWYLLQFPARVLWCNQVHSISGGLFI